MALIGYEIVQSRTWIDPNAAPAPLLNHKNVFPITVFDAVRENMYDENSRTLQQVFDDIDTNLKSKQPIIPAMSPSNIMTYGGYEGAIGSIRITESIINNPNAISKIPTDKAVYEYVSESISNAIKNDISWEDIDGRPTLYDELGSDNNGVISQKGITDIINPISNNIKNILDDYIGYSNPVVKSRPPADACDKNNNGNLIPDVQWVLNKVIELISKHEEEFMEKLKDILPCFTTPPPPPQTDEVIEAMDAEDIEAIVNGEMEGEESDSINISGYLMSRIPDAIIENIIEGDAEPEPAGRIVVEDIWIEAIEEDIIEGIMDGTIEPPASEDLIIPAGLIEQDGCECPCCTGELYEPDEEEEISIENNTEENVNVMSADMIAQLVEAASNDT